MMMKVMIIVEWWRQGSRCQTMGPQLSNWPPPSPSFLFPHQAGHHADDDDDHQHDGAEVVSSKMQLKPFYSNLRSLWMLDG